MAFLRMMPESRLPSRPGMPILPMALPQTVEQTQMRTTAKPAGITGLSGGAMSAWKMKNAAQ